MNAQLFELKKQLSPIAELIGDKQDVFYLDYPFHLNVGDLLIYHGTEQYFKDYQINVCLRRSEVDFDLEEIKKRITPKTTLLCHGGGNFGDLYLPHQNLRETLIKHFPNNRIIVLPQTLYYKNDENLQKSAALFSQHKDCHLFARDQRTFEIFKQFSPNVYLSPDMAHELYGTLPTKDKRTNQQLYFLRKDIEASEIEKNIIAQLPLGSQVKDWDDFCSQTDKRACASSRRVARFANQHKLSKLKDMVHIFWYFYTQRMISRMAQDFLANDKITTTRLHGHIFASLLEIPNCVCDNAYGKNTSYAKLWTKDIPFVELTK